MLEKAATGIEGFDDITFGGLPRARATIVTGAAGSGKSMFGVEFLAQGARAYGEPGVLLSFEETADELVANAASIGVDLRAMADEGTLVVDSAAGDLDDLVQSGAFDLEGLLLRLAAAIDAVGARRVVLDTVETLFSTLPDETTVRREFARLLRWLKERDLTVVVTAERGQQGRLTRHGIEEYVSDCVVVLDHRVEDEVATRRMRVAKYRGSPHGTNEFPFLISGRGLVVMPLHHDELTEVSEERVSLGIPELDTMVGGGVFRGSTIMISGSAGTGKTSIAACAADAACRRGEKALFLSFEEPSGQVVRNMRSIGLDLQHWIDKGLLVVQHMRPAITGLEAHLASLHMILDEHPAEVVVLDAVASLSRGVASYASASAVARDIAMLRLRGATTVLTALAGTHDDPHTDVSASSLVDAWLLVRNVENDGERNRLLMTIKNRGSFHSNQVREFLLTDDGPRLVDVFVGPDGVLTGSAREQQEARDASTEDARRRDQERRRASIERRREEVEAQIATLRRQLEDELADFADVDDSAADEAADRAAERADSAARRVGGGGP
ncbi:circadian clock protein KaiC [Nocardioides sp. CFH 31398]|uniref:circadian clock protein KaiC n=1 Tax=Nocardioides sp. CFH 31398 TaxID=2919579 RepID=UPI001F06C30B|nr:circadian clock protein KaiC [Nocardioides sp. CFH 31398]